MFFLYVWTVGWLLPRGVASLGGNAIILGGCAVLSCFGVAGRVGRREDRRQIESWRNGDFARWDNYDAGWDKLFWNFEGLLLDHIQRANIIRSLVGGRNGVLVVWGACVSFSYGGAHKKIFYITIPLMGLAVDRSHPGWYCYDTGCLRCPHLPRGRGKSR